MPTNKRIRDPMPDASASVEELIEFWDTHSTADDEYEMEEVEVKFDLRGEMYTVAVVPALIDKLERQAKARGVTTETLINFWLAEKLMVAA